GQAGYQGVVERLVAVDEAGQGTLNRIGGVAGPGGTPSRDGAYEYDISDAVVSNACTDAGPSTGAGQEVARVHAPAGERSERGGGTRSTWKVWRSTRIRWSSTAAQPTF